MRKALLNPLTLPLLLFLSVASGIFWGASESDSHPVRKYLAARSFPDLASHILRSRNGAGSYSLPAGNPVVTGTTIASSWANTTLADIGTELTNSFDRNGRGCMLAPAQLANGTTAAPSLTFCSETGSGLYRNALNDIRLAVGGVDDHQWTGSVDKSFLPNVISSSQSATGLQVGFSGGATGLAIQATGNGSGFAGVSATGGTNGNGLIGQGTGSGIGVQAIGGSSGVGGTFANGTAASAGTPKNAVQLTNGYLDFGSTTLPNSTTAIAASTLTPMNAPKAWAYISANNGVCTVVDGINITSCSVVGSGTTETVVITLASTMASYSSGYMPITVTSTYSANLVTLCGALASSGTSISVYCELAEQTPSLVPWTPQSNNAGPYLFTILVNSR